MKKTVALSSLALLLLTGCSGLKALQADTSKNPSAETTASSSSASASARSSAGTNPFAKPSASASPSASPSESPSAGAVSSASASPKSDFAPFSKAPSDSNGDTKIFSATEEDFQAAMKEYPVVPEGTSESDAKVLTPAVERISRLLVDGHKLDEAEDEPIIVYNNSLLADLKNMQAAKDPNKDIDSENFLQYYEYLASAEGAGKVDLESYNQEVMKHVPLADYIYYPEGMTPAEVAAFHYYWGLTTAYVFSFDKNDKPSDVLITEPTIPRASDYSVENEQSVVLKNLRCKVLTKEGYLPMGVREGILPELHMQFVDGAWKINAKDYTYWMISS